ncbi:MAG: MFS transporter [Candidatus Sericytochromatia bacterium]
MNQDVKKISIFPILLSVFMDLLGIGIIIPVVAPLVIKSPLLQASTIETKDFILGFLISSYALSQFFSAPVLGALSDKLGRKKVLIFSIIGTIIGYLIFSFGVITNNLPLLFLGRIVDGITAGNLAVIYSSLADISDEKTKARNFGLVGMCFGLGFVIGPFIGGQLTNTNLVSWFNYSTPFLFCASLSFINLLFIIFKFQETLQTPKNTEINIFTGVKNIKKAFSNPALRNTFFVSFLTVFGFTMFSQFFQVFLLNKFPDKTEADIGILFGYFGIWSVITQGGLVRRLSKKYQPEKILPYSIPFMALMLLTLIIPDKWSGLYISMALVSIAQGITSPNVNALVSNLSQKDEQGEVLGINQSVSSLGQAIPPIIGGVIIVSHLNYPVIASSICIFIAWLVFTFKVKKEKS